MNPLNIVPVRDQLVTRKTTPKPVDIAEFVPAPTVEQEGNLNRALLDATNRTLIGLALVRRGATGAGRAAGRNARRRRTAKTTAHLTRTAAARTRSAYLKENHQ